MVSKPFEYFHLLPVFKGSPLDKKHHLPPFSSFSRTEVPIPWFTNIIYEIIQTLDFSNHVSHVMTLWRYDITVENILKYTIMKHITYNVIIHKLYNSVNPIKRNSQTSIT